MVSHDKNIHDSKTLDAAITHANSNRTKPIQQAVCDRGYVGVKEVLGAMIILPKKALKRTIVINEIKSANCVKGEQP
ncbi:hypothetical protein BSPWISOXPB_3116 [uncultured Gammaproteobacteria bacterium]|nr:hypothetical protein BSPWISOXPB_3116 [uncultured Gammaproteobacteria bacterium]